MTDRPIPDCVRTAWTPVAPLIADSSGKVINASTSSGAIPGASVITVTRGPIQIGKHVDRQLHDLPTAIGHQEQRQRCDQHTLMQGKGNDSVQ